MSNFDAAVAVLRRGGVIAYPTEAVWGLGCDPRNAEAVTRILRLKQRPASMGLILIGAEVGQVRAHAGPCPAAAWVRAEATWPGPHTWVFPACAEVPAWIRGEHAGIALRVTAHPVAAGLCRAFGGALVSTSANRHGEPPGRSAEEVQHALGADIDLIVPGELGGLEQPTPIRDAISGEVLRH